MKDSNILIVEGNLKEENHNFLKAGIKTHTESLKDSLLTYATLDHHKGFANCIPSSPIPAV